MTVEACSGLTIFAFKWRLNCNSENVCDLFHVAMPTVHTRVSACFAVSCIIEGVFPTHWELFRHGRAVATVFVDGRSWIDVSHDSPIIRV